MAVLRLVVAFGLLSVAAASLLSSSAQSINTWLRRVHNGGGTGEQTFLPLLSTQTEFPELFFSQPLDHFSQSLGVTFGQRYWVNARHYVKGGPVIVLDGGETSGEDRLPFLDTGIVDILATATNGLGIVLEHRYYGASIPVKNFSTDALRWLNNAQALQDSARFVANFQWNGEDLSAPKTKWIYYGGSYAGARAAHVRVLFGDLIYGSLASSAVTHAAIDFWEYNEAIRTTANQTCTSLLTTAVAYIDHLLSLPLIKNRLKSRFGLSGLDDQDFASVLSDPINYVQAQNWDPQVGSDVWPRFCQALGSGKANSVVGAIRKHALLSNYAQWIREEVVSGCTTSIVDCFGTRNATQYQDIGLSQTWRAWQWQVCTEWGYFIGAPPDPSYPTIVSRRLTLEYTSQICRQAFPAGKYAQVPAWPNVTAVNVLGDFTIAKDRLAFIDGYQDPWRPATPHSWYAPARPDTLVRPFKMIKTGLHHYDENGLKNHTLEPPQIRQIHTEEVEFVKSWLGL